MPGRPPPAWEVTEDVKLEQLVRELFELLWFRQQAPNFRQIFDAEMERTERAACQLLDQYISVRPTLFHVIHNGELVLQTRRR